MPSESTAVPTAGMSLAEVGRILDWLNAAHVTYQVNGGWAVDALVGRQTREHSDLDVFLDSSVMDAFLAWLEGRGYHVVAGERPVRIELASPQGRVDAHPMTLQANGDGVQAGFDGAEFVHRAGDRTQATLAGRPVVVACARRLWELRQGYRPRSVDLHDLTLLDALNESLPRE